MNNRIKILFQLEMKIKKKEEESERRKEILFGMINAHYLTSGFVRQTNVSPKIGTYSNKLTQKLAIRKF